MFSETMFNIVQRMAISTTLKHREKHSSQLESQGKNRRTETKLRIERRMTAGDRLQVQYPTRAPGELARRWLVPGDLRDDSRPQLSRLGSRLEQFYTVELCLITVVSHLIGRPRREDAKAFPGLPRPDVEHHRALWYRTRWKAYPRSFSKGIRHV